MPRRRYVPPSDIEPLFHFCRHCGGDYTPQEGGVEGGLPGLRAAPLHALRRVRPDDGRPTRAARRRAGPSAASAPNASATPAASVEGCTNGPRPTSSWTPTAGPSARRTGTTGTRARSAGSTSPQTTSRRERTRTSASAGGAPRGEGAGSSTPTRTSRSRYSIVPRGRKRTRSHWESNWRWTGARRNGRRGASSRSQGATTSTSSGTRASRTAPNSSRTR